MIYGNGTSPIDAGRRELEGAAAALEPVMEVARKWARPLAIADFAEKAGVTEADARAALIALEQLGMVETTHFKIAARAMRP